MFIASYGIQNCEYMYSYCYTIYMHNYIYVQYPRACMLQDYRQLMNTA